MPAKPFSSIISGPLKVSYKLLSETLRKKFILKIKHIKMQLFIKNLVTALADVRKNKTAPAPL